MTDVVNREGDGTQSVHVINVEIKDNHQEAEVGGKIILRLVNLVFLFVKCTLIFPIPFIF
jgi:hypothetical protein